MKLKIQKIQRRIFFLLFLFVLLLNVVVAFHAYKFTHYNPELTVKTKNPDKISFAEKIQTLAFGVNNPRPANKTSPLQPHETIFIQSNKRIACWFIKADKALGTTAVFHGYGGSKSSMLDKADFFLNAGYNVLLVDFMGSGDSEGNQVTIGFKEAQQVKSVVDYLKNNGEKNILLFGTSMGAAAIMKAQKDHRLPVKGLILECPFGTMLQTVEARFSLMNVPSFPMAHLLVLWGGLENGFNAFKHNPVDYAKEIDCPVLLLYGEKDRDVSLQETETIFKNLKGIKKLKTYPLSGHENYLVKHKKEWTGDVGAFLQQLQSIPEDID